MTRLRPYPEYTDSGIEWLGQIPGHWETGNLKRVCSFAYGESLGSEVRVDGNVEVFGSNGPVGFHDQANTLAPCLVIGRKGSFGKVNYSSRSVFAIDTTFYVDKRFTRAKLRWLFYVLQTLKLDSATKDSAIPGLDREDAYGRDVALCSPEEQNAIAGFLDRETSKIDALVEKKERLIELLQEKRIALITHAVTKGLDPNVPMKDSGIERIGSVPTHWTIRKATWLFSIGSGTTPNSQDPSYYDGDILWITTSELRESVITATAKQVTRKAQVDYSSLQLHPEGSVAVAMYGATIGRLGILGVPATVNQACCVFSDPQGVIMRFWFYWLQMRRAFLVSLGYGGGQPNLSQELLRSIRAPIPTVLEQQTIADFLDRETAKIDTLIAKVGEAIERLKEYRTALVSAAVTGKIDVRNE